VRVGFERFQFRHDYPISDGDAEVERSVQLPVLRDRLQEDRVIGDCLQQSLLSPPRLDFTGFAQTAIIATIDLPGTLQ
jgi:hypothetical protein